MKFNDKVEQALQNLIDLNISDEIESLQNENIELKDEIERLQDIIDNLRDEIQSLENA